MKAFTINTLGCKVNQYESQQYRQLLESCGLRHVELADKPDLVLINTCCVTHTASAKSRQYIRKAQKQTPAPLIVVSGCLPIVEIGELTNLPKNINIIRDRKTTAAALTTLVNGKADAENSKNSNQNTIKPENNSKIKPKSKLTNSPQLPQLTSFKGHTRAFLKIQDGCDGYCSYCIIPKTRQFVHSKPPEEVLQEARALVKSGHKEIVVTGIFLGAFCQKTVKRKYWESPEKNNLADLIDQLAEIPNLERIRLSSLEPGDVTDRLLDTFAKHHNIMPHLHLSLQSGSNAVLKKMCRQYSADEFREKVALIKSRLDRPAITCDILVGFPGETDADFCATVELAKEVGFAKMHVFAFSARKGTAAAAMPNAVSKKVIKERSQILRDLDIELGQKFRQQFVGQTALILLENDNPLSGRSERYFMVYLENTKQRLKKNDLITVILTKNTQKGLIAQTQTS